MARAAERLSRALYAQLGRWIGVDGCGTLLRRALVVAMAKHPGILVRSESRLDSPVARIDAAAATRDPVAATAALEEVFTVFMEMLGRFIGEELALRLVEGAWPLDPPSTQEGPA